MNVRRGAPIVTVLHHPRCDSKAVAAAASSRGARPIDALDSGVFITGSESSNHEKGNQAARNNRCRQDHRTFPPTHRFHTSQCRQCGSDAFGRKWHFAQARASRIEDRVPDGCGDDHDYSFARAGGEHISAIQERDVNRG